VAGQLRDDHLWARAYPFPKAHDRINQEFAIVEGASGAILAKNYGRADFWLNFSDRWFLVSPVDHHQRKIIDLVQPCAFKGGRELAMPI
jgi:hypothetical protein